MSKISRVLTRRRPRKPVLRHSPSSLAAAERVAARDKEAPAPEPVEAPAPAPEPVEAASAPVVEEDVFDLEELGILDLSVADLTKRLATGEYDNHLQELFDAEQGKKNRKGALSAIKSRMG